MEDPWSISFEENEYNRAISYQGTVVTEPTSSSIDIQRGKLNVRMFVSAKSLKDNGLIAVGLTVPEVGDFDTADEGTGIPNGPGGKTGSPFKSPEYVDIHLVPAIDYSKVENLEVTADEFWEVADNQKLRMRSKHDQELNSEFVAITKRIVEIGPKTNISGNKFLIHKITGIAVTNEDVSTGDVIWGRKKQPSFNVIKEFSANPGVVISRGESRDTFELNLWYAGEGVPSLRGYYYVENQDYVYECESVVSTFPPAFDPEAGKARLIVLKSVIPHKNCKQINWKDSNAGFSMNLADIYGNDGRVQVHFNNKNYFDIPHISD